MTIRNVLNIAIIIASIGLASNQVYARSEIIAENCHNQRLGEISEITYESEGQGSLRLKMTRSTTAPTVVYENVRNKEALERPNPEIAYRKIYRMHDRTGTLNLHMYLVFGTKNEIHVSFNRPSSRVAPDPVFRQENNFVCEKYFLYPQN
jgi:hypothetical protein